MKSRIVVITIGLFLLIGNQSVRGESRSLEAIIRTVSQLREVKVEAYDSEIPLQVKPLLIQFKHQLCDLILETMNAQWNTPQDIRQQVLVTLQQAGIPVDDHVYDVEPAYFTYDKITDIQIEQPAEHPDMLVATVSLWVMCGGDTAFYLFQKIEKEWCLIAVQEATTYQDIGDAQQAFQYAISPADKNGQFFVVTANTHPWCTSFWNMISYRVFRVGANPYQPKILFQGEEDIYQGHYTITIHPAKFWIIFSGNPSEYQKISEYDGTISTHILSYDVNGEQVTGIDFVPEDYLLKWSELSWEDALKWVDPALRSKLHPWHTRLREIKEDAYSFSVLTSCKDNPDIWQIGIQLDDGDETDSTPQEGLCFTLIRDNDWYRIQGIQLTHSSECPEACPSNQ